MVQINNKILENDLFKQLNAYTSQHGCNKDSTQHGCNKDSTQLKMNNIKTLINCLPNLQEACELRNKLIPPLLDSSNNLFSDSNAQGDLNDITDKIMVGNQLLLIDHITITYLSILFNIRIIELLSQEASTFQNGNIFVYKPLLTITDEVNAMKKNIERQLKENIHFFVAKNTLELHPYLKSHSINEWVDYFKKLFEESLQVLSERIRISYDIALINHEMRSLETTYLGDSFPDNNHRIASLRKAMLTRRKKDLQSTKKIIESNVSKYLLNMDNDSECEEIQKCCILNAHYLIKYSAFLMVLQIKTQEMKYAFLRKANQLDVWK